MEGLEDTAEGGSGHNLAEEKGPHTNLTSPGEACVVASQTRRSNVTTGWSEMKNFLTKSRSRQVVLSQAGIFS